MPTGPPGVDRLDAAGDVVTAEDMVLVVLLRTHGHSTRARSGSVSSSEGRGLNSSSWQSGVTGGGRDKRTVVTDTSNMDESAQGGKTSTGGVYCPGATLLVQKSVVVGPASTVPNPVRPGGPGSRPPGTRRTKGLGTTESQGGEGRSISEVGLGRRQRRRRPRPPASP